MRMAVIERDGVLHYALKGWGGQRNLYLCWYIFCDSSGSARTEYHDDDVQKALPTCVRCLGEEILRGKNFEPIDNGFEGYEGLVHRAVHVVPAMGGYYGHADCNPVLAGRTVRATPGTVRTCVRCLVAR